MVTAANSGEMDSKCFDSSLRLRKAYSLPNHKPQLPLLKRKEKVCILILAIIIRQQSSNGSCYVQTNFVPQLYGQHSF